MRTRLVASTSFFDDDNQLYFEWPAPTNSSSKKKATTSTLAPIYCARTNDRVRVPPEFRGIFYARQFEVEVSAQSGRILIDMVEFLGLLSAQAGDNRKPAPSQADTKRSGSSGVKAEASSSTTTAARPAAKSTAGTKRSTPPGSSAPKKR